MIGIDTNVLVRYLVQDDPEQASAASRLIESARNRKVPVFISDIILCELVWVLESAYKYKRPLVADALLRILETAQFQFADKTLLLMSQLDYAAGRGDFSDALLIRINRAAGCDTTYTFDKKMQRLSGATCP